MKQKSQQPSPRPKQQYKNWITCLALVKFDIDQGQKVQHIIPQIQFSQNTNKQLAMLSFPDSNSFNDYQNSFKYTFKMYNGLYGYTCFKQKKDINNPRGFSQKSLVILSELPFVQFYQKMCQFIVFKTFNTITDQQLPKILLSIYQQSLKWPQPIPKTHYILPILQYELQISIPNYLYTKQKSHTIYHRKIQQQKLSIQLLQKQQQYKLQNILQQQQLLRQGPFQQIKLFDIFKNCHETLWGIWQCIILNKSLLIIGSNPQYISHAVLGCISLIYPFIYNGNFNPYITIYDPNLQKISNSEKNWIIGATNPLFAKFFNKNITQIITLDSNYKCNKNIIPLKQLLIKSNNQQQQAINQSAIRKYFYKLSHSVMIILDLFLKQQTNNLKFFNQSKFIKDLKDRKQYLGLQDVFSSKKYIIQFFTEFIKTNNFQQYLLNKNTIRSKQK